MIDRIEASADALWVTPDETGVMKIGFADNGRQLVGPVTAIEWLIALGPVKLGTPFMIIRGEQESLTLRLPFSGRVTKLNTQLNQQPEQLNHPDDSIAWLLELIDE